jgi:hypothetical protein
VSDATVFVEPMAELCPQTGIEAFNLTDRINPVTRNASFGTGSYPSSPLAAFNTVTAVGDPRTLQFGVRVTF